MKKLLLLILLVAPLALHAQGNWERLDTENNNKNAAKADKQQEQQEVKKSKDPKYLAGAVTEVDGKVVWSIDINAPKHSAQESYAMLLQYFQEFTKQDNQLEGSHVALVNKMEHSIAVTVKEWMVFKKSFMGIDRAKTSYTILAECKNGKVHLSLSRIVFDYTENDPKNGIYKAEEYITDEIALNKKKTKIYPGYAKFRIGMIDRKDEIFDLVTRMLR